ncbi:uncharacterized protein cobll1a isoform X2 [Triplophysa rosa]|uniref:Cordon-bleu protein-like 1 n=2 Tax=Triplophysa rosa TaxID=992332 RepID=A0A9W8C492_TRIRA|nr:uncharacterized protein cobll1a isoform X2 [Triplophysa rosa]KAI7807341.1 putative cordon-bleu protein-like 1 [Triplophysa rosa]
MDPQEDLTDRDITLSVQLPGGQETTATVHGSKPVMDVLVILCAQHRLVPSDHVIKLVSTNQNHISFKPNSPIGSLEFEKVLLQAKGSDDANRKKPHLPVPTVRLLINYKKSHKAVVRVNPRVPLAELMPSLCEKCEFNPDTTLLMRTYRSEERLDLTKTLNDYGIRELYAKDMKVVSTNHSAGPVSTEGVQTPVKEKNQREKGNKGFFGFFKKSKKTSEQVLTVSAPGSPELNSQHAVRETCLNGHSALPADAADMPKKRPAPRAPLMTSQSVGCELVYKDFTELSEQDTSGKQGLLSRILSTESSLKRTKRKAPPPPSDADNKENDEDDDNSSDKSRAHVAGRCPAIAEVMSELVESLQARHQRKLSSEISPTVQHQEFQAPPGCHLLRNSCEREGLTTFTVVPQRRFEVSPTQQISDTAETEQDLSPGALEHPEIHTEEPAEEEVQSELFKRASETPENLSEVLRHLEKENQTWTDVEMEKINNGRSLHLKNIKEDLELFRTGLKNLKPVGSQMTNNLRQASESIHSNIDERQERAPLETCKEENWMEEYKERRRKFIGVDGKRIKDARGKIKREFRNSQMEVDDENFPYPPPPVCWHENNSDGENASDEEMETATDARTRNRWPNRESHFDQDEALNSNTVYEGDSHLSKPKAHSTQTKPEPEPVDHGSVPLPPGHPSKSRSDACSLFALAVFQKAKHCRRGMDPKHNKR